MDGTEFEIDLDCSTVEASCDLHPYLHLVVPPDAIQYSNRSWHLVHQPLMHWPLCREDTSVDRARSSPSPSDTAASLDKVLGCQGCQSVSGPKHFTILFFATFSTILDLILIAMPFLVYRLVLPAVTPKLSHGRPDYRSRYNWTTAAY